MVDQNQTTARKWKYNVQSNLSLPRGATSPVMDSGMMTDALDSLDARGWELVTYGQTQWSNGHTQEWWVFRRPWSEADARF